MTRVFIEGLPAGGKTHLLRYIESKGHQVTHELGRVLKPEDFPGDGKTIEEILRIHDWFIEKEHNRFEIMDKGIFERSFITQLGYAYAYPRYVYLDAFEKGANKYADAISSGKLLLPDLVLYVTIDVEESIRRQEYRYRNNEQTALPEFWTKKSFLNDLINVDNAILSSMSDITIIKIDGALTTQQKYEQIESYLNNMDNYVSKNKKIDMNSFIQKLK